MTAEIAIMNKTAIALAADSAVTIGNKIYNTVNKLFSLSKFHPVGIMIFGNADLMEVPWETIIKIYRKKLKEKKFKTLRQYAEDFMEFLNKGNNLFPSLQQKDYFGQCVYSFLQHLGEQIDKEVQDKIQSQGKIKDSEIEIIVSNFIKKEYDEWGKVKNLKNFSQKDANSIVKKYENVIKIIKEKVFQKLPISPISFTQLKKICGYLFIKDRFLQDSSGIVIAGFGENENFPSLISFTIEGVINNKMKYRLDRTNQINFATTASIHPFAQNEMVFNFMEGLHPSLNRMLNGYLKELFEKYPNFIVSNIKHLNDQQKKVLLAKIKKDSFQLHSDFNNKMEAYRKEKLVDPVINAVQFLPKDELALMAETLVSLTSFKRKISMSLETVGGPIDVAVISKGDGFIWIKRKHYFKAELNPYFLANYYRKE